jgi:uncharacterized membrane protein YiaA
MKTWFWLLLAVLILCSFTLVLSQRTPVEKNRRETLQQEQLKRLMSGSALMCLRLRPERISLPPTVN